MTASRKAFLLAFILAPNGGGGDVSVSAGGYSGTKLGQTCGTAAATAAAYQSVITSLRLNGLRPDRRLHVRPVAYYQGANWTAQWWTQGGTPPTDSGAWVDDGPCTGDS